MEKSSYVYIITNKNKTVLYIGVTSNLQRRIYEHKSSCIPGFTKKYKVKYLIYYEEFNSIAQAINREKSLKGKTRLKKEKIIAKLNPDWSEILIS